MLKIIKVFLITFAVLGIFVLFTCSKKKPTQPPPPLPKWTILGYFDGNNPTDTSGTNSSYVIKDVQEMEQVGSTKDVQVVVMLGSVKTEGNCNYYLIKKYLDEPPDSISSGVLDSLGKKDMSDPQTLRNFIKYGVEHYPAQHYMLIINDHGSGWKGACSDQQNGDGEMMTLPEFSSALFGYKFEIILFYAPSMSMLEVAYQLKDKADYLIASQFNLPMQNILGSSKWLQDLADNPDISSRSLVSHIVDEIYYSANNQNKDVHIAGINLSKVDALASKVADLGNTLVMKTGAYWNEVYDAWKAAHYQNPYNDFAFTDIKEFAKNLQNDSNNLDSAIKNDAQEAEKATGYAVIKSLNRPISPIQGGLSIHLPWEVSLFDSTNYVQLDFTVSNWHIFLSRFIQSRTGSLRIVSEPVKGARIFLDEQDTGLETDTTIHGIPEGSHTLKLVKAGWHMLGNHPVVVQVMAGTTSEITIGLFPGFLSRESLSEL